MRKLTAEEKWMMIGMPLLLTFWIFMCYMILNDLGAFEEFTKK